MFSWKVFQVRLVILFLLLMCLWVSARSFTEPIIAKTIAATFGSSVEFGNVEINLSKNEISFSQLQIADPIDPMRNLVRARRIIAVFDPSSIWNRQLVILQATANDVLLASPREKLVGDRPNGAPENWNRANTNSNASTIESASKKWLDRIQSQPPVQPSALVEFAKSTERMRSQWNLQFETHLGECQKIQSGLEVVKSELSRPKSNPLRETERRQKLLAEFDRLQIELAAKQAWIEQWQHFQDGELEKLKASKEASYQPIETKRFDPATIAESKGLLICEKNEQIAAQLVEWMATVRLRIELLNQSSTRSVARGRNVLFHGAQASPVVTIKQLAARYPQIDLGPIPANHPSAAQR